MIILTRIVILSFSPSHLFAHIDLSRAQQEAACGPCWPRASSVAVKSTLPTQHEIRMWGHSHREEVVCLFMSSISAHPEGSNTTVLCREGDSEVMRITGTNGHIIPSFKVMYYHVQILHILIWLSLLSFSQTEAKSGKWVFPF